MSQTISSSEFTPTGETSLVAFNVSSSVALPSVGSTLSVLVANDGAMIAYVALGSSAVVATPSSIPVNPGQAIALAQGLNTTLAAITADGIVTLAIQSGTGTPTLVYGSQPGADVSSNTVIAAGTTTSRTLAKRFPDIGINVADFGAVGDCVTFQATSLTMAAGANPVLSVGGGVVFSNADVGKSITVPNAGPATAGFLGTISAVLSPTSVQIAGTPSTALNGITSRATSISVVAPGAGFVPGDTVTFPSTGGVQATQVLICATQVVSAAVNAPGTGGTPGPVTITGTSFSGSRQFQATGTIDSSGHLTGPLTVTMGGFYTVNPHSLSAEPVNGANLTGATVTLVMGVATTTIANITACVPFVQGAYATPPATPITPASTSGSGTGATFGASWVKPELTYGTDNTAAFNAASAVARAIPFTLQFGNHCKIVVPGGGCYFLSHGWNLTQLTDVIVDGSGSVVHCADAQFCAVDFFWTTLSIIRDLCIEGDFALPPKLGFQVALGPSPITSEQCGLQKVDIIGFFSLACFYNCGSEHFLALQLQCGNKSFGPTFLSTYCAILDGINHWNIKSRYVTQNIPQDSLEVFGAGTYIACSFNGGTSATWLAATQGIRFIGTYWHANSGYGAVLYSAGGNVYNRNPYFNGHWEGVRALVFMTGPVPNPRVDGITIEEAGFIGAYCVFMTDTNITHVNMQSCNLTLDDPDGPKAVFDDETIWTVTGFVVIRGEINWKQPLSFSGWLDINGTLAAYLPDMEGDTNVNGALTATTALVASGSVASVNVITGGVFIYPNFPTVVVGVPPSGGRQATATVTGMVYHMSDLDVIVTPGTGYHVGSNLTVVGGTITSGTTVLQVTQIDGNGGVMAVTEISGALYSAYPPMPATFTTGGGGSGFTLTMAQWGISGSAPLAIDGVTVVDGGAGYLAPPLVDFTNFDAEPRSNAVMGSAFVAKPQLFGSSNPLLDLGAQTFVPTTGGTVSIPALCATAIVNPAGTLAALTVQSPPAPTNPTGSVQPLTVIFMQAVTTLSWSSGAGSSYGGAAMPTSAALGASVTLRWAQGLSKWLHSTSV